MSFSLLPTREQIAGHESSVVALLIANALPLFGVFFLGWKTFDVVFIYWTENVVIGVLNVAKMIFSSPNVQEMQSAMVKRFGIEVDSSDAREQLEEWKQQVSGGGATAFMVNHGLKLFLIPFFCFHYGMFCLVHGVFVCVLLGNEGMFQGGVGPDNPFETAIEALQSPLLWLGIFGLAASHVVSFFTNYLGQGEYRRTHAALLMAAPYPRVVVLHIAIILGGFAAVAFGSPVLMLVPLIVGKTLLDLAMHLWQHSTSPVEEAAEAAPTTALDDSLFDDV